MTKPRGKIFAFSEDLKVVFDSLDRDKLWKVMEKRGESKHIMLRLKEIYRETINKVKVNGKESEYFYTEKGVRQGCPLSPSLFTLYVANLEERLRLAQAGSDSREENGVVA